MTNTAKMDINEVPLRLKMAGFKLVSIGHDPQGVPNHRRFEQKERQIDVTERIDYWSGEPVEWSIKVTGEASFWVDLDPGTPPVVAYAIMDAIKGNINV